MEKTLTNRDKALLLILGIIIIVFAAVMIPAIGNQPIGIYSLITDRQETAKKIEEQDYENQTKLTALIASGVNPAFVENGVMARNRLMDSILDLKYAAAKISQTINKEKGFATGRGWVELAKYEDFVLGNTQLLTNFKVVSNKDAYTTSALNLGDSVYNVLMYEAEAQCEMLPEKQFVLIADNYTDVEDINILAAYAVLASQMARRGSIVVLKYEYDPKYSATEGLLEMPFALYVPESERLADYSVEICECHECGQPYLKSTYEDWKETHPDEDYICSGSNCDAVLDGSTIG